MKLNKQPANQSCCLLPASKARQAVKLTTVGIHPNIPIITLPYVTSYYIIAYRLANCHTLPYWQTTREAYTTSPLFTD